MATNATAYVHPVLIRLAREELYDQLEALERVVWAKGDLDGDLGRRDVHDRVSKAVMLAAVLVDLEPEPEWPDSARV